MQTATTIESIIRENLAPTELQVINESDKHNVPPNSETHFKLVVVSEQFIEQSLVARHRIINKLLAEQLAAGVHALSLQTHTPDEWLKKNGVVGETPDCLGGDGRAGG